MATLRKRYSKKSGSIYHIDFVDNAGKRRLVSTHTSSWKIAQKALLKIQDELATGKFSLEKYRRKKINLRDFVDVYLKTREGKSPSTYDLDHNYLNQFLGFVGNKELNLITPFNVSTWKADFLSKELTYGNAEADTLRSKKRSPSTFNVAYRHLHASFQYAVLMEFINGNPFDAVKKEKPVGRRLFLKGDEIERIFTMIDDDYRNIAPPKQEGLQKKFRLFVEFLLLTGLRRGEGLNLRKSRDVDFARREIYVERTKDKEFRVVPLFERALQILGELDEELFGTLNGHNVTEKFTFYLRKAGLTGFRGLHTLRHTFATVLLCHGIPLNEVSKLLGHSDLKTTQVYAKLDDMVVKRSMQRLEEEFFPRYDSATKTVFGALMREENAENLLPG